MDALLTKRAEYFKRLFAKGIGRTPSGKQKFALARAATLTAAAERAATDPLVSANDLVRLDNSARRARTELQHLIEQGRPKAATATLAELEAIGRGQR
jgi:hypothetical protein